MQSPSPVYADANATVPPSARALRAFGIAATRTFGNPSSVQHAPGRLAAAMLEHSRRIVAACLEVPPTHLIFTSCGTESNNLAIRAVMDAAAQHGKDEIVVSAVEHASVLVPAGRYRRIVAPVRTDGSVCPRRFEGCLGERTAMVCVMHGQNEVGTLDDVRTLARIARDVVGEGVVIHVDATQAIGKYDNVSLASLGADVLAGSAHKFHGVRGAGILCARPGVVLPEFTTMGGGGQEGGVRSSTENVPAIAAAAAALREELDLAQLSRRQHYVQALRDRVWEIVDEAAGDAAVLHSDVARGMYNTLNFTLPVVGCTGIQVAEELCRRHSVAVGTGSACHKGKPSHVLTAMGCDGDMAARALRVSFSRANSRTDADRVGNAIVEVWRRHGAAAGDAS